MPLQALKHNFERTYDFSMYLIMKNINCPQNRIIYIFLVSKKIKLEDNSSFKTLFYPHLSAYAAGFSTVHY